MSSFSDPKIIKTLSDRFIPATDNDWYNRRRKDAAGEFFMKVARQGPRGEGSGTKQGHYILTPSGKLLGFNNNRAIEHRIRFIENALAKWDALPDSEKLPGAVKVPPLSDLSLDSRFHAEPPEDGVVLLASERLLKAKGEGFAAISPDDQEHRWGHLAAVDRVWIKADEWETLVANGAEGAPLPAPLAYRLLRYHLIDYTRGEPPFWRKDEVREQSLRIDPAGPRGEFLLSGSAKLATADGARGFDVTLHGKIAVDGKGRPSRFDLVALGEHWGEGTYTRGARPGKTPLGIAFQLADLSKPANRVRPQGSHFLDGYWRADR